MLFNQSTNTRDGYFGTRYTYLSDAGGSTGEYQSMHMRGSSGTGTGTGSEEHSSHHADTFEGGSLLRRYQGSVTRYGTSTFRTSESSRVNQKFQTKLLRKYDEQTQIRDFPGFAEEHDLFLERQTYREEASKTALFKFNVLKKLVRSVIFIIVILVALLFMSILATLMDVRSTFAASSTVTSLSIKTSSCYIYIKPTTTSDSIGIKLSANERIFTPSILFERSKLIKTFTSNDSSANLQISHDYEAYTCTLEVTLPTSSASALSFSLNCTGVCTLISREEWTLKTLSVIGFSVHSNLKKLSVDSITVDVNSGFLQFNDLETSGASSVSNTNGTTTIQTRSALSVSSTGMSDSYCFSAPSVQSNTIACSSFTITNETVKIIYEITSYNLCSGSLALCPSSSACSPSQSLALTTITGSFYVNLLSDAGSLVQSESIETASGAPFSGPISFKASESALLQKILAKSNNALSLPLILKVDVGNFKAESSAGSKWIITEYPLTSVYDPWSISSITFGILTKNFKELNLALSPGFCPWRPVLNRVQFASIKSLLSTVADTAFEDSIYTGVVLEDDDYFLKVEGNTKFGQTTTGFYEPKYDERPQIYDIASKFGSNIEEALFSPPTREYNNINISTYINYIVFVPVFILLWYIFKWWKDWSRQIRSRRFLNNNLNPSMFLKEEKAEYYCYLNMESKDKNFSNSENHTYEKDSQGISFSLPSFNLYVELMFWKVFNRISDPVDHFYDIIFDEKTMEEIYDEELTEGLIYAYQMDVIREFYQQFCYWSLFEEEDLFNKKNINILMKKGYRVVDREEDMPMLKKLLIKKNQNLQVISEMNVNDYKSSLHAFIELLCLQTNYDSDEVSLELFLDNYVMFCNLFRLEQVTVEPNILKREFNIDSLHRKSHLIERNERAADLNGKEINKSTKFYKINLLKIAEYLNLLKGSTFSEKLSRKYQKDLIKKLVFPKSWLILDFIVCITIFLIMYVLLFFYIDHNENLSIMLSNFKRIPENERIRDFSSFTIDGNIAQESNFTEPMSFPNAAKSTILYAFLSTSLLVIIFGKDMFNYYNASRSTFLGLANDGLAFCQWTLLFFAVGVFMWSILQYLIATMIYSLMKIYALLPYVFSSLFFVFFIWYFIYNSRKRISTLEETIKTELRNLLISRYIERLRHAANYNNERQKNEELREKNSQSSIQGSNQPLSEEEINFTVGQVMSEVKEVCMLPENWRQFIESVLLGDKQKMQAVLAEIVEVNPLNLPQGSFELICQILNIDENMESPELFISVISSILLKIILGTEKVFIKDLRLRDLETLKTCGCDEEVFLDKNFVCRNCKDEKLYSKNKQEIFRLTLEKNTYIFQLLISLIDLIRKKNTGKILEILIEKIIPEGMILEDRDITSCLVRLTYMAFFEIDQNFNRTDWAKCINDILLNFFKSEQNKIQLSNLLEEGRMDNPFDLAMNYIEPTDTINSVKRCVTSEGEGLMLKHANRISNFLSLATIFLGRESEVPEKLMKDCLQMANKSANKSSNLEISQETIQIIFRFLIFSRETPKSIINKISLNASKYFLDKEISDSISSIKSIASGISRDIKTKDYHHFENSVVFIQIRKVMNLQPYEMLGFIYLINDKVDDDEVSKFFHHIFTINHFQKNERTLFDLISIAISRDYIKLGRAIENLKLKYHRLFAYMRDIIPFSQLDKKYLMEIVQELPVDSSQIEDTRILLSNCIEKKDLGPFMTALLPKQDTQFELNMDNPKMRNLRHLELIWMLTSDEKMTDVLVKFKSFFRELDDPLFLSFSMKLYTVLEFITKRKKVLLDSTISKTRAVKVLADLMLTKSENIHNLLELFLAERTEDFISSFCYFNEECRVVLETNGKSLKNHIQYIDKSIRFLQAQIEFYSSNPIEYSDKAGLDSRQKDDDLGVIIIKKIMMPEVKLKNNQIMLLLDSIITKIFNDDQIANRRVRIMKFFTALFVYVLGDLNSDLGDYFEKEHGEPFLKTLINCRGAKSATQRMNTFFEDSRVNTAKITPIPLFVYLTLFLRGLMKRDEFNKREEFEGKLEVGLGVNQELFDYLDVFIHKNKLKFKSMLMKVHWKILKQIASLSSFKREDVDWDQLYENIVSVISDKQPNLTFFSELLNVPLSKLNFVYILNNLKNTEKVDKVLQEANSSSSFKEIIEQQFNVDHSEFIQIIRLCLNKAGFESLDILLKKMNLNERDQIDINLLVSLVTIDAPLHTDPDMTRELIKRMMLYSMVFLKMKINKELAWAFIRILKGDMISFKKFLSTADSDTPLHHKKFLNMVVALAGCKNSPLTYFGKEGKMTLPGAIQKYCEISFDSKKKRENSKEAAHILLSEQLDIHPVWGLLEYQVSRKVNSGKATSQKALDFKDNRIPIRMFHFLVMYSISGASTTGFEIFSNLSFFHNVVIALENMSIKGSAESERAFEELRDFYREKFRKSKEIFRKRILQPQPDKDRTRLFNLSYNKGLTDYWMFDELTNNTQNKEENKDGAQMFYKSLNVMLLDHWKNKLIREDLYEGVKEVFPKLYENFEHRCLYDAFSIGNKSKELVAGEGAAVFGQEMFEHFLDSVVELMLTKMKELNEMFFKIKEEFSDAANKMRVEGELEEDDEEEDDEMIEEMDYNRNEEDGMVVDADAEPQYGLEDGEPKGTAPSEALIEAPKSLKSLFVSDGIIDFCLYASLAKLRRNTFRIFEEKVHDADQDMSKIDSLFNIAEKASFFTKNFSGFRKKKYMTLFSFSQGMVIDPAKSKKMKYSLYSPELALYSSTMAEKLYSAVAVEQDLEFDFDPKEFLGKLHMVKDMISYDVVNLSIYSPFNYSSFDIEEISQRKTGRVVLEPSPEDVYLSQFMMRLRVSSKEDLARLANDSRYVPLVSVISSDLFDPTTVSFYMLYLNMYSLPCPPDLLEKKIEECVRLYFSKSNNFKESLADLENVPRSEFEINLKRFIPCNFFLNDLALGDFRVLSETRNTFSNTVQYSKYQKIYEAILKLHHLGISYSETVLCESMKVLSPYLASDSSKLIILVDYILNTKKDSGRFKNIGRDLDFQNNQISDLLFLFNNNKGTAVTWLTGYLNGLAMPSKYVSIICGILVLFLDMLGKKRPETKGNQKGSQDNFLSIMNFLMNNENAGNHQKRRFECDSEKLAVMMQEIMDSEKEDPVFEVQQRQQQDLYELMVDLIRQKVPLLQVESSEVASNILELTIDVLEKKFRLLNPVSEDLEKLFSVYFGVNNTNLLNIFKLIDWLTRPKDNTSTAEIENHFFQFLNFGNFNLMDLNIEKIKLVLMFLKNFNKADVTGILGFLRDLQLTREYVYIFSRYMWIVTLNKNFKEDKNKIDSKLTCSIAVLNWYPFIEIVLFELQMNQPSMQDYIQDIITMRNRFITSISKIPFDKVFHMVDTNFNSASQDKMLSFLSGESFMNLMNHNDMKAKFISEATTSPDLRVLLEKLSKLFFFSTNFFSENSRPVASKGDHEIESYYIDYYIDYGISFYIKMLEMQCLNQEYIEELFETGYVFSKSQIEKKFESIFKKAKGNQDLTMLKVQHSKEKENIGELLFSAGKYLRFVKYYVLQIKSTKQGKLEEIKQMYQRIFIHYFHQFLKHAVPGKMMVQECEAKENRGKRGMEKLGRDAETPIKGVIDWRDKEEEEEEDPKNMMTKEVREAKEHYEKELYRNMLNRMINLFLNMKFKKNLNYIFLEMMDFLTKFIFRSNEKPDKIQELIKKINVESFFELYDNIYENRNIFNRNAENILRLSLATFVKFNDKNDKKMTSLVKVCRGSISDLSDLLKELGIRNDRAVFAMNQIKWCNDLVKSNTERLRISEHRKVNSRLKNSSNARFLNELSTADQLLFIENLKKKSNLFTEVMPYFEAHLSSDSSYYSKYDVFKLMKRMGFEMSIHRLNEIVSEATEGRRRVMVTSSNSSSSYLTREELKNCLNAIESKIMQKVKEMKRANLKNMLLRGIVSSTLAYFTMRVYMVFLKNLWLYGNNYSAFVSCIPILGRLLLWSVFILVIGFFFIGTGESLTETEKQIRRACKLLFTNFSQS